jgi:hypothetical protein
MAVIQLLGRWKWEDLEFEASLGKVSERAYLKNKI